MTESAHPAGPARAPRAETWLDDDRARRLARVRRLARLLDGSIRVPGTRFRVGLDPIVGLVPGLGDLAGLAASLYLLWEARALGISRATRARMLANVVVDAVVGAIPIAGDLFDAVWKANLSNVALIERELEQRGLV